MAIKLVIFDLDGTLVDAYPAVVASVNMTLISLGFSKKDYETIKRAVGWGDKELLASFVGQQQAADAVKIYRPHHAKALVKKGGVRLLPGAKGIIEHLAVKGYRLAIATNRPSRFTHIILRTLNIRQYFDIVYCADKALYPKPHGHMIEHIVQRLKLTQTEAMYVGDMTIDAQTGKNANVATVCVTTGSSDIKELKALKPHAIISRISDLKKLIKQYPGS